MQNTNNLVAKAKEKYCNSPSLQSEGLVIVIVPFSQFCSAFVNNVSFSEIAYGLIVEISRENVKKTEHIVWFL